MAKKVPFVPKPAIEKLPLAVRKDLRDNYESKKADFESQLSELLGFPVTLNINVNEVWAYGEKLQPTQAGSIFTGYIDGLIYSVKTYVEKYGDLGKEYFKNAVTKSEFTLTANEAGDEASLFAPAVAADVKDGVFRILFNHGRLGSNQSWLSDEFAPAIDSADHQGFSLFAKHSIQKSYEDEIETIQEEIGTILAISDVVLDPNFEANYAALLAKKENKDWQQRFGEATFDYFKNLKGQLTSQGFDKDDMLQEGFAEAVESKTFKLRIVDKTKDGSANETVIEGGVVYLNATVARWWSNVYDAGEGLINLL